MRNNIDHRQLTNFAVRRIIDICLDSRGMTRYTVTTTTDLVDSTDAFLSLREAIEQANANIANDEIIFDSSVFLGGVNTTISLASALPAIAATSGAGSLTITGNGASRLTVNANLGNFSVFSIASGSNLTISGVTVTGANNSSSGGGFFNDGTLIITDCSIGGNAAANGGGIYQDEGNGPSRSLIPQSLATIL